VSLFNLSQLKKNLSSQQGIAHIALIVILVMGVLLAVFLVQRRTNLTPHASEDQNPQTAFHLLLDHPTNISAVEGGSPGHFLFKPGEEIRVNVAVSADLEEVNTFLADITYPKDFLEIRSIIKQGSDVTQYGKEYQ
jgi:hypothetical protein